MMGLNTKILIETGKETHEGKAFEKTLQDYSLSVLLEVFSIGFSIFLIGLNGYHTFLIYTAQTTNEQIKKSWVLPSGNPFQSYFIFYLF